MHESKKRDRYGELGWNKNFAARCSKNNDDEHISRKEFFDRPANYQALYSITSARLGDHEYYRNEAPKESVAKSRYLSNLKERSQSLANLGLSPSPYSTPFILDPDRPEFVQEREELPPLNTSLPFL